jgi:hypothetical protein
MGIYGDTLHAHPTTSLREGGYDNNFTMFHPHLQQHLLVDNGIARLNDIGIVTNVGHYHASISEESIARKDLVCI